MFIVGVLVAFVLVWGISGCEPSCEDATPLFLCFTFDVISLAYNNTLVTWFGWLVVSLFTMPVCEPVQILWILVVSLAVRMLPLSSCVIIITFDVISLAYNDTLVTYWLVGCELGCGGCSDFVDPGLKSGWRLGCSVEALMISRSSALTLKTSCYPIAKIAAKLFKIPNDIFQMISLMCSFDLETQC
ncbi:uncharacterized protein A4U43_C03F23570 [Asparagus officinalis]|uniref:Uncharacterized protein n=1 Tax=Asparagus officinalis TaxID=4686 RepID=A0A5P1FHK4_ASPOF|nr:uncharacterized protein A4U43_C03F23570 [Asparagus officinalis]